MSDQFYTPEFPQGVSSSVGTIMLPSPYPIIAINDEHERNEFARAALIGMLSSGWLATTVTVDASFELADKMLLRSKVKPKS